MYVLVINVRMIMVIWRLIMIMMKMKEKKRLINNENISNECVNNDEVMK